MINKKWVLSPSSRCAAGSVNDYLGPDRSAVSKSAGAGRQNVKFKRCGAAGDAPPSLCWVVIKEVPEGGTILGDYGECVVVAHSVGGCSAAERDSSMSVGLHRERVRASVAEQGGSASVRRLYRERDRSSAAA